MGTFDVWQDTTLYKVVKMSFWKPISEVGDRPVQGSNYDSQRPPSSSPDLRFEPFFFLLRQIVNLYKWYLATYKRPSDSVSSALLVANVVAYLPIAPYSKIFTPSTNFFQVNSSKLSEFCNLKAFS